MNRPQPLRSPLARLLPILLTLPVGLTLGACGGRLARGISEPDRPRVQTLDTAGVLDADWSTVQTWEQGLAYPPSAKVEATEVLHGTEVQDPYRWMEAGDSEGLGTWIAAQNETTQGLLRSIPTRPTLRSRLEQLWDYERFSPPTLAGERVFYSKNDGLQNQAVLYVADSLQLAAEDRGRILLDPNTLSGDGTVALADTRPSPGGKLLAYATSDGGSDWRTWRFVDVETGEALPDVITRNKFGGLDWVDGAQAVVYSRFAQPMEGESLRERNLPAEICLHVLGTDEEADVVVRERPSEGMNSSGRVTNSRRALIVSTSDTASRNNELEVLSLLPASLGRSAPLVQGFDAQYYYVGNLGKRFWIQTNLEAPNWRVIEIDLDHPQRENWRELIPEADEALEGISAVGGRLIASYLKDASTEVRVFDLEGQPLGRVKLPGIGTARGFRGELDQDTTFFLFTSFTTPAEVWRYDIGANRTELFRRPTVDFDPARFVTTQVRYRSKDGTSIPMFLVHAKGLALDGNNPTLLYGYGGFNVSLTPSFSVRNIVWMEQGGVYAVPSLRGGGEYGEAWHQAGTKLNKQNVFDDFIAAAEWLIAEGYTSPEHLAIAGGSNGGLLVGACMTQRPDLFGACLPAVGVMDMLRYHLFTIGWAWVGDYGSVDDPNEFRALLAYSPYHNLRDGVSYPATLVTTADHDDRVVPAHSFKFAARLQEAQAGRAPSLIRIETRAGHGAGKPTAKRIDEAADILAFLQYALIYRPATPSQTAEQEQQP